MRVQARRLRTRLARYYREEGQTDEVVIELPKGGYVPTFKPGPSARRSSASIGATLVSQNTIAVLPFADHSAAATRLLLPRRCAQEVIHHACEVRRRCACWLSDTPGVNPMRAAVVITGSVRQSGNTVRVTTQLIDGASGYYLWSESVDADLRTALAAQEAVAA